MTSGRVSRFSSAVAVAAAIGLCLSGCSADGDDRPVVIVSTNILGDVVQQLVGDEADVVTLMKPNADPHSFEISAQEGARLRTADLI
ncbi:zinc ABC transporter substrate-binding protein, partial [Rhodococcus fascians]|nr:zinc ABC transporter substrate-binding protein [Rhodococcus fascians]